MMKYLFLLVFISGFHPIFAQTNIGKMVSIGGKITGTAMASDSIHFNSAMVDKKYYETRLPSGKLFPSAKITNNSFHLQAKLSYPHLFMIVFESDRGNITSRGGPFYIDSATDSMKVDYNTGVCSRMKGPTYEEYINRFTAFVIGKNQAYDCNENPVALLVYDDKTSRFDSVLQEYVKQNPDSYVALWSLIERFSEFGHSTLREKTLDHFSNKIKGEKLWPIIRDDLKNAPVKENKKFPLFPVQTIDLKKQELSLPKAKYTLVDFWFCRCRPCIEAFPKLKEVYAAYRSKGFEIVGITTDKTENVPLWQKRIKEYELPWLHYLDENALVANKFAITSFPTTFLLNQKGEVIKRGITPEQLEEFLKTHL
jgi:thiol-disulfide isomerase/thioredoxin